MPCDIKIRIACDTCGNECELTSVEQEDYSTHDCVRSVTIYHVKCNVCADRLAEMEDYDD